MSKTANENSVLKEQATNDSKNIQEVKRMGLVRFLQLKPQKSGIEAILKRKYAMQVHTLEDWEQLTKAVLAKKVK